MALKKITGSMVLAVFLGIAMSFFSRREVSLTISYTLNYEGDSWQKNRTGFLWALSYLGAELPKGCFDKSLDWIDSTTFKIRFHELGFNDQALQVLEAITDSIKNTRQYRKYNSIDLGQFIALTIGSSPHYYAITGVPAHYADFSGKHGSSAKQVFPLLHSTVAMHNRRLSFSAADSVLNTIFVAEEGSGDLALGQFKPQYYEVMDVMPNGQLRFAVYDGQGNLADASPKSLGAAGKPAKCVWCHELVFQPLFEITDSLPDSMSPAQFGELVNHQNKLLDEYRRTLHSEINFENKQDHTFMELIYISYMEPSLRRLSKEWHMSEHRLKRILRHEKLHQHPEFDFLKDCYARRDVNPHAPCRWIEVSEDIREPSNYEPSYLAKLRKQ
ncbi:MAG: hypothetical protein JST26_02475 [Bacteroidetes bacterium]|nr:hypothetical protein [Bacteroidota bacterium]